MRKEFGSFVAVERADFAIARGEFFSMLGPSGCGKTTLLQDDRRLRAADVGRVLLEGVDVSDVPPHKRNVNTVFQQYALFPHMSIVDNVAFGLRSKKVPAGEARRRAMEMLDVVQLAEFADRRSTQLSGGQQQRVALARALVNLPAPCCSTSRSPPSTSSCARRCRSSSSGSSARSASRSSSSPTTRARR